MKSNCSPAGLQPRRHLRQGFQPVPGEALLVLPAVQEVERLDAVRAVILERHAAARAKRLLPKHLAEALLRERPVHLRQVDGQRLVDHRLIARARLVPAAIRPS
jgi:hypothetical protein